MFGYVLPVQEELKNQEYALYNAFYCGICLSIKARLGELARFCTGYDMTFLALLASDVTNQDVNFGTCKCIGSPIRKHSIVQRNSLMDSIADVSIILAYHKAQDNIVDGRRFKGRLAARLLRKAYNIAKQSSHELDSMVASGLCELDILQRDKYVSIDRLAHPFANLIRQVGVSLAGSHTSDNYERLCYNIGKFVYLIDALDDLPEDIHKGTFNAWLHTLSAGNPQQFAKSTKLQVLHQYGVDIQFGINSTINMCIDGFNSLDFVQSYSVLKNIVHLGLRHKLNQVLSAKGKLSNKQVHKDMRRTKSQIKLEQLPTR
ncbi:MAG: DUF5685 family protein [Clostridiales bacterium]|jgi:hypothetical protein|nr:DUF5685 family protein [Clostridiales bacterium]